MKLKANKLILMILFCIVSTIVVNAQEVGRVYQVQTTESTLVKGSKLKVEKVKKNRVFISYTADSTLRHAKITQDDFYQLTNGIVVTDSVTAFKYDLLLSTVYNGYGLAQGSTWILVGSVVIGTVGIVAAAPVLVITAGVGGVTAFILDRVETHKTAREVDRLGRIIRHEFK